MGLWGTTALSKVPRTPPIVVIIFGVAAAAKKQPLWVTVEKTNISEIWNDSDLHFWGWHKNEKFWGQNPNFRKIETKKRPQMFFWY